MNHTPGTPYLEILQNRYCKELNGHLERNDYFKIAGEESWRVLSKSTEEELGIDLNKDRSLGLITLVFPDHDREGLYAIPAFNVLDKEKNMLMMHRPTRDELKKTLGYESLCHWSLCVYERADENGFVITAQPDLSKICAGAVVRQIAAARTMFKKVPNVDAYLLHRDPDTNERFTVLTRNILPRPDFNGRVA